MRVLSILLGCLALGCVNGATIADFMPSGPSDEPRVRTGPIDESARNDYAAGWTSAPPPADAPVLYARDGSPVGAARHGEVVQTPEAINDGVDPAGGSRTVILQLYAKLKREHEVLLLDYDELAKEHEGAETHLASQRDRIQALESRVAALSKRNGELDDLLFELAGRLAQAQIARLESERALLEASVDWRRMNAANSRAAEEPRR